MDRNSLLEVLRRMVHYATTGTTAIHADGARRNPISTYTDPEQFALEKERIFRHYPQLVCFSSDLAKPGDFRTHDDLGIPIVVVRGKDACVRAFVNQCAHRSARLVEGCGSAKRGFVCPYHAWAYDLEGKLTGLFKSESFGRVDRSQYRLVELPCEEKHGFVYVSPDPNVPLSVDEHLGELGAQLGSWGLQTATHIQSGDWQLKSNWKLALDTFCEGYHFGPLHPDTVGQFSLTNCMTYDRYGKHGEHHRVGFPNKQVLELPNKPESEWGDPLQYFAFVYYVFPNISLLISPDEVELFRLFPGASVDEHVTRYSLYLRQPAESEARRAYGREHFQFIYSVVDKEDYWVSQNVQRNFNAGMRTHTTFGANEPSLINMHRTFRRMAGLPLVDEPAEIED
jgi:phenylpropionate dioxygenase-like ring-hydroxylating dioxygenase large terminal subunit